MQLLFFAIGAGVAVLVNGMVFRNNDNADDNSSYTYDDNNCSNEDKFMMTAFTL